MKDNYNISELNPRPNPYYKTLQKTISIDVSEKIIEYFKNLSAESGLPYQTVINLYLEDCVNNERKLEITWKQLNP